jgi:hypothetical protein
LALQVFLERLESDIPGRAEQQNAQNILHVLAKARRLFNRQQQRLHECPKYADGD